MTARSEIFPELLHTIDAGNGAARETRERRETVSEGQRPKTENRLSPIEIIDAVRSLSPLMRQICRNGSCYRLYLLLKAIFPTAEPYFDADYHVVTRIGNLFYDIDGEHKIAFCDVDLMTPAERERQATQVADWRMMPTTEHK